MNRRIFLQHSAAVLGAFQPIGVLGEQQASGMPSFETANLRWQRAYDRALKVCAANVEVLPADPKSVLTEGSVYHGIWMECGPLESLVYRKFRPDVARNSHMTFFEHQRFDGQLPYSSKVSGLGWSQIQMVVPIAATAWDLARATGDDELLRAAYKACSAWDRWLMRYRNTRGTGLTEGFCTFDTGNDNSPRWAGVADSCPGQDATRIPPSQGVPRLCPDLSATTFGARVALSKMAAALGKRVESDVWNDKAQHIRNLVLDKLYDPADAAFYDLDTENNFVKVRSEIITRVCSEHVIDQDFFNELWMRQIHNSKAFWPAFPLPSIAVDDPHFVRPIPRNSWGGASQALTALRATRWLEHYKRAAEFATMMELWCECIQKDGSFRTQIDPLSGAFTQSDAPNYTPCALLMIDFTWRLAGVHEEPEALWWNVRWGHPASHRANFLMATDDGVCAGMQYDEEGATLTLNGRLLGRLNGTARLITDKRGRPRSLIGISGRTEKFKLQLVGEPGRVLSIKGNEEIRLK